MDYFCIFAGKIALLCTSQGLSDCACTFPFGSSCAVGELPPKASLFVLTQNLGCFVSNVHHAFFVLYLE